MADYEFTQKDFDLADQVEREYQSQKVKQSFTSALEYNPDVEAQRNKLAKEAGVPRPNLTDPKFWEEVDREKRSKAINFDELVVDSPATARALQDENFAKIAHDDVNELKNLERVAVTFGKKESTTFDEVLAQTEKQGASAGYFALAYGPDGIDRVAMANWIAERNKALVKVQENYPQYMKKFNEDLQKAGDSGIKTLSAAFANPRASGRTIVGQLPNQVLPMATTVAGSAVGTAAISGVASPLAAPVGAVGGGVAGGFIGSALVEIPAWIDQELAQSGVDITNGAEILKAFENKDFIEKIKGEAERKGVTTATVDAVWNGLFAGRFAKAFKPVAGAGTQAVKNAAINTGKVATDIGVQAVGEGVSEGAGQLAADGTVNMQDVALESVMSLGQSAFDTSFYSQVKSEKITQAATELANQKAEEIKGLHDAARAAKTAQRDPEAIKRFVENANPDGKIYIQNEAIIKFFQELPDDKRAKLEEVIPDIRARINEADASGADVEMSRADYVAYVAQNPEADSLNNYIRTTPDDMTISELMDPEFLQELYKDDLNVADPNEPAGPDLRSDIEKTSDNLVNQLLDSGRITSTDAARQSVAPIASFLETMRARGGSENVTKSLIDGGINVRGPVETPRSIVNLDDVTINKFREYAADSTKAYQARMKSMETRFNKKVEAAKAEALKNGTKYVEPSPVKMGRKPRNLPVLKFLAKKKIYTGSVLAGELRSMDVTPKTMPWLFTSTNGPDVYTSLDTISPDDINFAVGNDVFKAIGTNERDTTGYYASPEDIFDAIDRELSGNPVSGNESDAQANAYDDFVKYLGEIGIDLETATNEQIKKALNDPAGFLNDSVQNADADGVTYNQNGELKTETEAFKKWFGDSKVVDENGKPLVVYHGTRSNIDKFEVREGRDSGFYGQGIYFTKDREEAADYAESAVTGFTAGPNIIPVYVSLKNPFIWDGSTAETEANTISALALFGIKRDKITGVNDDALSNQEERMKFNNAVRDAGFDGVIVKGTHWETGEPEIKEIIAFRPEQIKSVFNQGTFDGNDNRILFQSNLDDQKLVTVHNIKLSGLRNADKIGGLPVPSLAITRQDIEYDSFGEITLIAPSDMVDPKKDSASKIFDADVYSPRYPKAQAVLNEKTFDKALDKVSKINGDVMKHRLDSVRDAIIDGGLSGAMENGAVKYAYLKTIGKAPEVEYEKRNTIVDIIPELKKFAGQDFYQIRENNEFIDKITTFAKEKVKDDARLSEVYFQDGKINFNILTNYAHDVSAYGENKIDNYKTETAIRNTEFDFNDYQKWVDDLFSGVINKEVIFDGFTPTGNRRYLPHNLDNVVKILKRELKGGEGFNYGVPSIRAVIAKKFRSLKDVKADKGRLITAEEMDAVKDEIGKDFDDLWNLFSQKLKSPAKFGDFDNFSLNMQEYGQTGRISVLEKYYGDLSDSDKKAASDFIDKLKNLPTQYFEVKLQRAVKLNEFAGAVIPDNAPDDIKAILDSNGIAYKTYKSGDNKDRADAVSSFSNDLGNVLFQKNRGSITLKGDGRFKDGRINREYLIELSKSSNLSTFLHETGHLFLDVMNLYAQQPETAQQIKDDMQGILDWLGVKTYADIKTEHHEKFARGFEAYLRSGDAPSVRLHEAFRKFKAWLKRLYSNEDLQVNLNPEIKAIFDRMLATDEEIAQVSRKDGFKIDNEALNILPKDARERYQKLHKKAMDSLEEKTLAAALKEEQRTHAQWYKEERAKTRAENEKMVNSTPVYRAMNFIKTGKYHEGDDWIDIPAFKLDRKKSEELVGKTIVSDMPKWLFGKNGIDPSAASELMGYIEGNANDGYRNGNGQEFLLALANAPDRVQTIEKYTNEDMVQRHGDMMTDGRLEKVALEKAHNRFQAEKLKVEGDAVAKLAGVNFGPIENYEIAARNILGEKRIQDAASPHRYYVGMVRASKAYGKAIRSKNWAVAVKAKRQQLIAHNLYMLSVEAQKIRDKQLKAWDRLKKTDEQLSKSMDVNYIYVARAILGRYGVLPYNPANLQTYFGYIRDADPDVFNDLILAVQDNTREVPEDGWRGLTYDEFLGLKDSVDNVLGVGRREKQIMVDGKKVDKDEILKELFDKMNELPESKISDGRQKALDWHDKFKLGVSSLKAGLRRVELWAESLDGQYGGVFRKYVWNPIHDARSSYLDAKADILQEMVDLLKPHADRLNNSGSVNVPEISYTFASKSELIGMLTHIGNESNYYKLWKGRDWNPANLDEALKRMMADGTITKDDMELVQGIWNLHDRLKPQAQKAHKEMYGYYFSEVTAWPVETPWGTYKGGYVPAIADQDLSQDSRIRQANENLIMENNAAMFPTTGRGFTKSRNEGYAAPLKFDIALMSSHTDKVLRFIHLEPAVKDVAKLVNDKKFREMMDRIDPRAVENMLIPWLQRAARQTVELSSSPSFKEVNMMARFFRRSTSAQAMMLNLSNAIQQVTGFMPAIYKVGGKSFRSAFVTYMKNPTAAHDLINASSSFMRHRNTMHAENLQKTAFDIMTNPSKFKRVGDAAQAHGYIFQTVFQNWVDGTTWMAAYNNALEKGMNEREAVRFADSAVSTTQGSTTAEDMSRIEAGSPLMRLFTMFYSYFNAQSNLFVTEIENIGKTSTGLAKAKKMGYAYLMIMALPSIMAELIVKALKGQPPEDEDDDGTVIDDWLAFFVGAQFRFVTAMIPFAGQVINTTVNAFNDKPYDDSLRFSPAISMFETLAKTPKSIYDAVVNDGDVSRAIQNSLTTIGFASGLPLGQLGKPLGYLADVIEGDAEPENPVDIIQGIITGPPPKNK